MGGWLQQGASRLAWEVVAPLVWLLRLRAQLLLPSL